jgi:hypothetical protein
MSGGAVERTAARMEQPGYDAAPEPAARRLAGWLLPPLLAFLLAHAVMMAAAYAIGTGTAQYLNPSLHVRWDSGQYLNIAKSGYTFAHCNPHRVAFKATDWCGSAGWFPLYPAVLRAGHALTGWDWEALGWGLSEAFALGTLLLVWWLLGAAVTARNLACLALAAVFPGSVYDHAVFPISLCTCAAIACLGLLVRGRWVLAGLAGAVATAAYPLGAVLAPVAGLWLLLAGPGSPRARLARGAAASGLVLLGLVLVAAVLQHSVGHWDAYLKVQRSYGNGIYNPIATWWRGLLTPRLFGQWSPRPLVGRLHLLRAPSVELLLVVALLALGLGLTLRRRPRVRADLAFALAVVALWLAPLVAGGRVTQYRQYALMLPLVVLLRDLPRSLLGGLVVVAAASLWAMTILFYLNALI